MSIQVSDLTYIYSQGLPHQSVALSGVGFDIEDGEFVGLIGHTGSGKSTLVQHLNGLLKPNTGSIFIGEVDITKGEAPLRDIRRKVGLVFQYPEYQLFEETVEKDVAFGPANLGLTPEETNERIRESLALVGLDYAVISGRSPFELSGGQKRRVAIAGVLAMRPEVLILDEPTAGLDPQTHKEILEMIERIHVQTGNITILVSHNMSDIATFSDRVLVLEQGKQAAFGTPREVFADREKLLAMGLSVPPVSELLHALASEGFSLRTDLFSEEEAADEIVRALLARKGGGKG